MDYFLVGTTAGPSARLLLPRRDRNHRKWSQKPTPGTREYAVERVKQCKDQLRQAIESKLQAEMAIATTTEAVLVWEERVAEWDQNGTIDAQMEELLHQARTEGKSTFKH
ncbi:hypothetical protein F5Y08DRAFT_342724 [Xylaria arbuscula]|nr:hypothetical protein F5Y08DRAFT_342724 [Xylaria arbuscula]